MRILSLAAILLCLAACVTALGGPAPNASLERVLIKAEAAPGTSAELVSELQAVTNELLALDDEALATSFDEPTARRIADLIDDERFILDARSTYYFASLLVLAGENATEAVPQLLDALALHKATAATRYTGERSVVMGPLLYPGVPPRLCNTIGWITGEDPRAYRNCLDRNVSWPTPQTPAEERVAHRLSEPR